MRKAIASTVIGAAKATLYPNAFTLNCRKFSLQSISRLSNRKSGLLIDKPAFRNFSLAAVLAQEIVEESADNEIDSEFVNVSKDIMKLFKIKKDDVGISDVVLTRQYKNETITVQFNCQAIEEDEDSFPDLSEETINEEDLPEPEPMLNFDVIVEKPNHKLIITCKAASSLKVSNVQYLPTDKDMDDDSLYSGPTFSQLSEEMDASFLDFLAKRKIDDDMAFFVLCYSREKEQKEYVNWLNKVLEFVEQK